MHSDSITRAQTGLLCTPAVAGGSDVHRNCFRVFQFQNDSPLHPVVYLVAENSSSAKQVFERSHLSSSRIQAKASTDRDDDSIDILSSLTQTTPQSKSTVSDTRAQATQAPSKLAVSREAERLLARARKFKRDLPGSRTTRAPKADMTTAQSAPPPSKGPRVISSREN